MSAATSLDKTEAATSPPVPPSGFGHPSRAAVALTACGAVTAAMGRLAWPFVAPAFRRHVLPYVPASDSQVRNVLRAIKHRPPGSRFVDLVCCYCVHRCNENCRCLGAVLTQNCVALAWVAVLFAWRMQVKLARNEAEERDKSAQPPKEFAESFDNIAGVTTVEKSTEAMRNRTGAGETTPP